MKPIGARAILLFGIAAFLLSSAVPRAATAAAAAPPPGAQDESYALHIVLADLTAVGMMASGVAPLQSAALASYFFTPPVIHLVHGQIGRALGSLGLRLLVPLAGGAIGANLEDCPPDREFCGFGGFAVGGLVGLVVASVTDAALLAGTASDNGSQEPERAPPPLLKLSRLTIDRAGIAPNRNGAGLLVAGSF